MSKKLHGHINPDGLRDIDGPITKYYSPLISAAAIKWGGSREGIGFKEKDVTKFTVVASGAALTESAFMNVIEALEGNYEAAAKLWDGYKSRLDQFRSAVKNDVTSLEASARKSTEATQKMKAAYGDVIDLLNSEEMQTAVSNAERLASAMQTLAKLQSHKLVFAVTDQSEPR